MKPVNYMKQDHQVKHLKAYAALKAYESCNTFQACESHDSYEAGLPSDACET